MLGSNEISPLTQQYSIYTRKEMEVEYTEQRDSHKEEYVFPCKFGDFEDFFQVKTDLGI